MTCRKRPFKNNTAGKEENVSLSFKSRDCIKGLACLNKQLFHINAFYRSQAEGYEAGRKDGRESGIQEGYRLGWEKGSSIGSEVNEFDDFSSTDYARFSLYI